VDRKFGIILQAQGTVGVLLRHLPQRLVHQPRLIAQVLRGEVTLAQFVPLASDGPAGAGWCVYSVVLDEGSGGERLIAKERLFEAHRRLAEHTTRN